MKPDVNARQPIIVAWNMLRRARHPMRMAEFAMPALSELTGAAKGGALVELIKAVDDWSKNYLIERLPGQVETFIMTERGRSLGDQLEREPMARRYERSSRARMWTAIRVLKNFGIKELTSAAEVNERTALNYLRLLVRAGYITLSGPRRWKLQRHTGPYHPGEIHLPKTKTIIGLEDRNTGERYPVPDRRGQISLFFEPRG